MRDRHRPRLCRSCQAPMARQEDLCWRCGTDWASEGTPGARLRVLAGGVAGGDGAPDGSSRAIVSAAARIAAEVRLDTDRWTNEGGGDAPAVRLIRPAAGRR